MIDTMKYYLPINSKCLAHYFGSACIMPSKYFENKPVDIQNRVDSHLLITTNLGSKEVDCCLELVLTSKEISELKDIGRQFFLFAKPLPVSRVKKILFVDKKQMDQTLANLVMSTAFIPKELVQLVDNFDPIFPAFQDAEKHKSINWAVEVDKYNRFLGGFALMRLASEDYMNYSENYFSTLSLFNDVIREDILASSRTVDDKYWDAFLGRASFKKIYPLLNKQIGEDDLNLIAREENQIIERDSITKIINLDKIEKTGTYTIAVLSMYGVGNEARKKRIDGLILSNFKSGIRPDKSEGIALCYGLNRGYFIFPNKYKFANNEKIVKFELNTLLDYYTIESIYQYVFNNTRSGHFPYLDNWCPKNQNIRVTNISDYQVLDVIVKGKKKASVQSPEYLSNLLFHFVQKDKVGLFEPFVKEVVETVYQDTLKELNEELMSKTKEIENLKKQLFIKPLSSKNSKEYDKGLGIDINYKKEIISEFLYYKSKSKLELEKEAKSRGLKFSKKAKVDDIIMLLITTPNNDRII